MKGDPSLLWMIAFITVNKNSGRANMWPGFSKDFGIKELLCTDKLNIKFFTSEKNYICSLTDADKRPI